MQTRTRTVLACSSWLAAFGCCAAGLLVTLAVTRPLTIGVLADGAAYALAFPLGYATIGLVLSLRRPANPIGWLYAASGLVWSIVVPPRPWVDWLVRSGRPLPLAAKLGASLGEYAWAPAIALGVTLPFLLLPDGRLRSRRWRVVVVASLAGSTLALVGGSLSPAPLTETPMDNPLALAGAAGTIATTVGNLGSLLHTACLPVALVCLVLRFRTSRGAERQQLRWVAAGAAAAVVGLLLGTVLPQQTLISGVLYAMVVCVPAAVAVAVLRYRLWDLDRLVSRTVTYATVTALLVVPYLLIVPAATRLAGDSGSLAVAGATLAAAGAFAPLRRRVQDLVDRRFNRARYDAARTVEGFAAHLREQVDLDALSAELLAVVDQTMQPVGASLWLRPPATPRPFT
ncbi:MAG TPA: hypothetical protein VFD04_17355 [Actinomycetes bacterium]|jgi:hypothetical protein|nr:hypothetical protein [Actinomycetes bacterium]